MSSVYATEPATSGRVIFETTDGPLEVFLWCKECPETTRLFLQLVMDGFFSDGGGLVFHRVINNTLIQTGALRHNRENIQMTKQYRQAVRASQALERRKYEVNSRIRFNHRGQVAMALGVDDPDDTGELQPQFFITLEDAEYLNNKHVIFGTISGPTIFNALRIGRTETDETTHQPIDMASATRILKAKIVDNPVHTDLVPQLDVPWRKVGSESNDKNKNQPRKKKKRKGKFDTNVLSFGTEFEEEDGDLLGSKKMGMQSSHDVVESKVLSKRVDESLQEVIASEVNISTKNDNKDNSRKKRRLVDLYNEHDHEKNETARKKKDLTAAAKEDAVPSKHKIEREKSKPHQELTSVDGANAQSKQSYVEARRLKYAKGKKSKKEREEETLSKLMAFRSTVQHKVEERKSSSLNDDEDDAPPDNSLAARLARRANKGSDINAKGGDAARIVPTYRGQVLDSDEEDTVMKNDQTSSWLGTAFKCRRHMDHDAHLGGDGRAVDDYEVIDSKQGTGRERKHKRHHHKHGKHKHRSHRDHRHKDLPLKRKDE